MKARTALLDLLAKHVPRGAHVLEVATGDAPDIARELAARGWSVTATRVGPALAAPATMDAAFCWRPTRAAALMPLLMQIEPALAPGGILLVADLAWQTAPTPDLLAAFAPEAGRERARPFEGYEMQIEHAGFDVIERVPIARDAWLDLWDATRAQRDAVAADERGAAQCYAWLARRGDA